MVGVEKVEDGEGLGAREVGGGEDGLQGGGGDEGGWLGHFWEVVVVVVVLVVVLFGGLIDAWARYIGFGSTSLHRP